MAVEVPEKVAGIRCKRTGHPDEKQSVDTCLVCHEALQSKSKGKSKPKGNGSSAILKRNALGWVEREDKVIRSIDEDGFLVPETSNGPIKFDLRKSIDLDGSTVSETANGSSDDLLKNTIDRDCSRVPETKNCISVADSKKQKGSDGSNVPETSNAETDTDHRKTVAEGGSRVSEIQIERMIGDTNELLADCIRRIRILEEKVSLIIEKDGQKRDAAGMVKLRNELFKILQDRYEKTRQNGIYVKSLYGPNGRKGGKLHISKAQAWRLRESCRTDARFKIEKADNQRGNWVIRLNFFIK
jgi:hypothetical protein